MLRNLEIKNAYNSDEDDLVNDFYNSVLSESILYRRATGYFTSGSLSIAAIGITSLIHNSGKIQAITGYQVNEEDYQAIVDGLSNDFFVEEFTKEIETSQGTDLDHLKLLSWMIATDRFEMKIAFRIGGIFHQKIGILTDSDGDSISFSGSQNESAGGWRNNSEEFKVFRSWIPEENNYFQGDIERFEKYWNGEIDTLRVLPLPEVIKEELLYIKPKDEELPDIIARVEGAYRKTKTASIPGREKLYKKPLRGYQKTAVQNWLKDKRGIFEMATGTGKTLTALGVVDELTMHGDPLVTIIAAPQKHLVKQWEDEIRKQLGEVKIITCNSDNSTWRKELNQSLFNYKHKIISRLIVLTTYSTMSSEDFIKIIKEKSSSQKNFLIIADEMHNSGH